MACCDGCAQQMNIGRIRRGFITTVRPLTVTLIGEDTSTAITLLSKGLRPVTGEMALVLEIAPMQFMLLAIVAK